VGQNFKESGELVKTAAGKFPEKRATGFRDELRHTNGKSSVRKEKRATFLGTKRRRKKDGAYLKSFDAKRGRRNKGAQER